MGKCLERTKIPHLGHFQRILKKGKADASTLTVVSRITANILIRNNMGSITIHPFI
jgi:hypothetical protein